MTQRAVGLLAAAAICVPFAAKACDHAHHDSVGLNVSIRIPTWYSGNRFHAHTRLGPTRSWCTNSTCKPEFDNVAKLFADIGVHAYVRHTHTGDDGDWMLYPSAPIPTEGLVPIVQATGRQLPAEFARNAHAVGSRMIAYHYPRCHSYYSVKEPAWLTRDVHGNPVKY